MATSKEYHIPTQQLLDYIKEKYIVYTTFLGWTGLAEGEISV